MPTRAEQLFEELRSASAVKGLIGECEDAHLDCKEWPSKEDDSQKMLAKAACGFTNAEGGVLVIGMKAESRPKDEPDVISATAPVADTALVKSKVLNLIGNLVEPGVVGVFAREIHERKGARSGFVVVYVPTSEGAPRRSRKDWKFYQRIGAGTFPMEYYQIEDMFGRRPHPRLTLILEREATQPGPYRNPERTFRLGLKNEGLGIARFPCIRFSRTIGLRPDAGGVDKDGKEALPQRASEYPWVTYQGGVDSVIYPDEEFIITKLTQDGQRLGEVGPEVRDGLWVANSRNAVLWAFGAFTFSCEISCEGVQTKAETASFDAEKYRQEIY